MDFAAAFNYRGPVEPVKVSAAGRKRKTAPKAGTVDLTDTNEGQKKAAISKVRAPVSHNTPKADTKARFAVSDRTGGNKKNLSFKSAAERNIAFNKVGARFVNYPSSENNGQILKCVPCGAPIGNSWQQITQHLKGETHKKNKLDREIEKIEAQKLHSRLLEEMKNQRVKLSELRDPVRGQEVSPNDDKATHAKKEAARFKDGLCIPMAEMVRRFEVLRIVAMSAIPRERVYDTVSGLNERLGGGTRIPRQSLDRCIPILARWQLEDLQRLLVGEQLSLIFDGTTSVGEVFACIGRWVDKNWNIQQRILGLDWLRASLTAVQQAVQLHLHILQKLGMDVQCLVACIRDGCAVNTLCVAHIQQYCLSGLLDISCTSHGVCLCGKEFDTPLLRTFSNLWSYLIKHSNAARTMFVDLVQEHLKHKAKVKWFATWMMQDQMMKNWPHVVAIVNAPGDFFPETREAICALSSMPMIVSTFSDWSSPW